MEHSVQIIIAAMTTIIGPLTVAFFTRRWTRQDRELADEVTAQLKAEIAQLREERATESKEAKPA